MATATENETMVRLKDFWKSSETEHNAFLARFRENFRFAVGGKQQWDPADVAKLEEDGKPVLTYNEILPKINRLIGEYIENMQQVNVFARRGGTVTGAAILTAIAKHASDISHAEFQQVECFTNGIIGGEGVLAWKRDYDDDPFNGNIILESKWPADVMFDESNRSYDANKGKFVFDYWFWDKEELKLAYPKFEKDIDGTGLVTPPNDSFFSRQAFWMEGGEMRYGIEGQEDIYSPDEPPNKAFKYRTRVCWWRSYQKRPYLYQVDRPTELLGLTDKTLERAKVLAERSPGRFRIFERTGPVLHKTVQAGNLILEDVEYPYGPQITRFPLQRFCPYWLGGHIMGVVDNAKDPQKEINKRASQTLHILNQIANKFWLNPEGEGADPRDIEEAKTGGVIGYRSKEPKLVQQDQMPAGHFGLWASNTEALGRIMGVRESMEGGEDTKGQSGIALYRKQVQGYKMAVPVFNRFRQTMELVYEGFLSLIRHTDVYSEPEIRQIVDDAELLDKKLVNEAASKLGPPPKEPQPPNPQAMQALQAMDAKMGRQGSVAVMVEFQRRMAAYQEGIKQYDQRLQQAARALLFAQIRSLSFGRYGVKIGQSPSTPTLRMMYFDQMLAAAKAGFDIPADILIEASDWPNKDRIVERVRQMAMAPAGAA